MSNEFDVNITEDMTADLREDVVIPKAAPSFVKPTIKVEGTNTTNITEALTPEQIIAISKLVEQKTRKAVSEARFDGTMPGQVLSKERAPITDFSAITLDDVYDLSIPIEAKAFFSADVLKIDLKDSNFEARWVNKNPQNLGNKIAKGFTYICAADLISENGIQTSMDAEGHYSFDDVVAMKIDKATYYKALRAAHLRAINTTDQSRSRERAAKQADSYMNRESGFTSDYQGAAVNKKMVFYDPGIEA